MAVYQSSQTLTHRSQPRAGMLVKNASRIKHLDGWDKPRTTPQMGRKQRQLV
jgi:hypothetical protein